MLLKSTNTGMLLKHWPNHSGDSAVRNELLPNPYINKRRRGLLSV